MLAVSYAQLCGRAETVLVRHQPDYKQPLHELWHDICLIGGRLQEEVPQNGRVDIPSDPGRSEHSGNREDGARNARHTNFGCSQGISCRAGKHGSAARQYNRHLNIWLTISTLLTFI